MTPGTPVETAGLDRGAVHIQGGPRHAHEARLRRGMGGHAGARGPRPSVPVLRHPDVRRAGAQPLPVLSLHRAVLRRRTPAVPAARRPGHGDGLTARTAALAVLAAGLVLSGCSSTPARTPAAPAPRVVSPSPAVPPPPAGTDADARAQLRTLQVAPRRPPVGYQRDAFGTPWFDIDGNGCNQRDDVLLRDAVPDT